MRPTSLASTAEEWIRRGRAAPLPAELCVAFDAHLSSLPWHTSSLDWSTMAPPEVIDVPSAGDADVRAWFSRTQIGRHSHVAIFYSVREGGLIVPTSVAIEHLDELYLRSPGVRFAFGLSEREGRLVPVFSALLEYGRGDVLTAAGLAS